MTFYTNHRTRKLAKSQHGGSIFAAAMSHGLDAALLGYLVGGFFVTVFYYPFFWINYAMTVALHNVVVTSAAAAPQIRRDHNALPMRGQLFGHGRA
jgi:hypothetical protein